jgi:hypothetical protein
LRWLKSLWKSSKEVDEAVTDYVGLSTVSRPITRLIASITRSG